MCGRYYSRRQKQEIAARMRAGHVFEDPLMPDYNIAPTTFQPIIRQMRDTDDRELLLARWGLIPFWAKSLAEQKNVRNWNAKSETITTAPMWRKPFKRRRCLVPVDGFYEWKNLDDTKKPKKKQAYAISLRSGELMALAGLWDAWREPKASVQDVHTWLQSFSIITTEPNEVMAPIHTRMPVILAERDWQRWLNRDPEERPPLDLLRPFDSDLMQATPCREAVGDSRNIDTKTLNSA